jgi:hypothetical protein
MHFGSSPTPVARNLARLRAVRIVFLTKFGKNILFGD